MPPPRSVAALLVTALTLAGAACDSDGGSSTPTSTTVTTNEVTTSSTPETTAAAAATPSTAASVQIAGQSVPVARLLSLTRGLCEAAGQAPTDAKVAATTFHDRAHEGLHLIARGLEQIDRGASAALLEAKQRVEGDFSRSAPGGQAAADLRSLHDVTVSSLARFNVTAGACPPAS